VVPPLAAWWSPAVLLDAPARAEQVFTEDTVLFRCTKELTCYANISNADHNGTINAGDAKPATAFMCREHHEGVLCANCEIGYFQRNDICIPCDGTGMSDTARMMLAGLAGICASGALLLLVLRRNAQRVKRHLVLQREKIKTRRKQLLRRMSGAHLGGGGGGSGGRRRKGSLTALPSALSAEGLQLHVAVKLRMWSLDAAQGFVKAAEGGDVVGETPRIVIGFGQVMHHLVRLSPASCLRSRSAAHTNNCFPFDICSMALWLTVR